ncbi:MULTISPECIES: PTS sugar transporter subunit IIA [unclassified Exiguobacterium]|uniref:PTS sugar transporter subunit IIA n=1 Tax=unclassified Exiguobacterium TaxID=2644629 RepID=UPI0025548372|nr:MULTISPECIES: PTS sugar transporter subunit IIA [unclassified Exiguobacterium]
MLEERRRQEKKRILLVCTYGMGTSKLIAARLHNQFHDSIHIVGYSSLRELEKQVKEHQPDLIISTVHIDERMIPVHVVSAVLTEQDVNQLRQLIGVNGNFYATIASLVEHVQFVDDILSRGHALHVLINTASIDERYSESVYNRERNGSTSIGQNVAIPHGDPELATTNRIDVLVLRTPIAWGDEQVRLIFLLQFRDSDQTFSTHLFEEIAALTENPKLVRELVESKDPRTFRNLLLP